MSYSSGLLKHPCAINNGFMRGIRYFGNTGPEYKGKIILCDKPKYSLCRKSVEIADYEDKFCILLDGKLLSTPFGNDIVTHSRELANHIKLEWEAQIDKLTRFGTVPLTLLLSRTLDFSDYSKGTHIVDLLDSLQTDTLLFYERCEPIDLPDLGSLSEDVLSQIRPLDLKVLQSSIINRLLDLFATHFRLEPIVISDTISKCPVQSDATLKVLHNTLYSLENPHIITVLHLQKCLKSLILPLMLIHKMVTPTDALRASRLEETLEAANWGVNDEFKATEDLIMKEIHTCLLFLTYMH
ncbi:conserved hypothetical protein [Theileria equi strain WA]|uniref:Uncharacterized protein n=1 Tax=Theileria equi strain WA TaxID=1537102 RepID=L1LCM9_THEEQ|nr:conserved hypothetical protein [Theileria equi strain WA]EKX73096.1 conserved hypothetical protein [Theileria equi strain WA]|eukprot:XP_004832548.1 conserved hypothetical protein [Theileria equi strain WA]